MYESLIAFMFFWGLAWLGLTNLKYFSIVAKLPGSGISGYPFFVVNGCIWILVGSAILGARKRYLLKTKETRRLATNAD